MNRDRIAAELPPAMAEWMCQSDVDNDLWEALGRTVATIAGARLLTDDPSLTAKDAMRHVRNYFELFSASRDLYARLRVTKLITPSSLPADSVAA